MMKSILCFSTLLAGLGLVQAGFDADGQNNIAVYWGQNSIDLASGPEAQQRLSHYCETGDEVDVFILSFVTRYEGTGGYPEINFANAQNNCTAINGTGLFDCPQIAEDIVTCQGLGKTILLSTGGSAYTEGGFTSEDAATASAHQIWEIFGPVSDNSSIPRPFGKSVVDGFDFDFEDIAVNNMPTFANELRSLYSDDTSKTYYMTAAPQCVFPDYSDNPMLNGTVYFDAVWVQFYNNGCDMASWVPNTTTQWNFDFNTWDNWAKTISLNPNVKVCMGAPGSTSAGDGYEPPSKIGEIVDYILDNNYTSFGGLMIWDASQVWNNSGFLSSVYSYLPN